MVLYFSGTGNSKYVGKRVADALEQELFSISNAIKNTIYPKIKADTIVFAVPTYAWRIPRLVSDWIKGSSEFSGKKAYFLLTCGGEIGNAEKYAVKLCKECNITFMGCGEVVMPENYIAMFDCPDESEAEKIVDLAEEKIDSFIANIRANEPIISKKISIPDRLKSGIVNEVFYPFFVSSKKYYTTNSCTGCGKCAQLCPTNNITIKDSKPEWSNSCTHCMACICQCPTKAIEYGKISKGKRRYTCPK